MRGMEGDVATAVVCKALPKTVNVIGTSNVPLGYRLRNTIPHKIRKPKILPDPRIEAIEESLETDRKISLLAQDERRHERKLISIRVQNEIDRGMAAYDEDLEERRDKLRKLLLIEEVELTRELIKVATKLEEERAAELAARAAESEKEREAERQELLHQKYIQRFVLSNPELREIRRRARLEDTKRVNIVQIAESEERRRMENEENSFWHQLMLDRCNAEAAMEAKDAAIKAENTRNMVKTLREQMEAKLHHRPPEEIIDKNIKILPTCDSLLEKQLKQEKNRKLREDLEAQLIESKRALEKRRSEERALDEMTWSIRKNDEPSEFDRKQHREATRKEALAYLESLKEFREALARRELETDEYANLWAKELDEQKRLALQTAKKKQMEMHRELKLAWDHQVQDKRNREHQELESGFDPDLTSANEALTKIERARRRQAAQKYGRELLFQHEEHESRRNRELCYLEEQYQYHLAEEKRKECELAEEVAKLGSRLLVSSIP